VRDVGHCELFGLLTACVSPLEEND
jgi:hypothetical protein